MFSTGLNLFSPLWVGRALGAHEMFWVIKHHPERPPDKPGLVPALLMALS